MSLDGKQSGLYRCDKMNGSWTYKLCNANSNKAKSVLGDMVQLQKYGYGFYLKEAVIQAIPHIGEKDIQIVFWFGINAKINAIY